MLPSDALLSCYVALFSKKGHEKRYRFSMFINRTCMPLSDVFNFVFQGSLCTILIKKVNAIPLWDFCASDFKVAILEMIKNGKVAILEMLFLAMTGPP